MLTLSLDLEHMTATPVRSLRRPRAVSAVSQGNAQLLAGGDTFVGWGATGAFSELAPDGRLLLDGHVPRGFDTYRAYRAPWIGAPARPPAVAAHRAHGRTTVYASRNGDTQVTAWQVLAGPSPDALSAAAAPVPWNGLETVTAIPGHPAYVAVRALDAAGHALGSSRVIRPA